MLQMTVEQKTIHERAMNASKRHSQAEEDLVKALVDVDRTKLFKRLNCPSLFFYTTQILGKSESVAYALISVARKTTDVPLLKEALQQKRLSVSKASRIVSALKTENAADLIEFARTHTTREIDFEVAKLNPKAAKRDKAKPVGADRVELTVQISKAAYEKLKRLESLQAQKNKPTDWGGLIELALDTHLVKHDPVKKAERAVKRKETKKANVEIATKDPSAAPQDDVLTQDNVPSQDVVSPLGELCLNRVANEITETITASDERVQPITPHRIPLTAEQKHAVFARDQGRCTHKNLNDVRCNSDKWIDVHHIIPILLGGSNEPENLTTLCSFHHDLVHQLSLPIEGQVNWLRSPLLPYGL